MVIPFQTLIGHCLGLLELLHKFEDFDPPCCTLVVVVFYYQDSEVVEWVVDLIFVEMIGKVVGFDSELELVAIDQLEEFDQMGVRIVVEGKMASIVDIEHRLHKDFSILDSKVVTVAELKAARLKTGKIVVV